MGATDQTQRLLLGRERDLETLSSALDRAVSGRREIVFVTGEAGIGKTRLAEEITTRASERGFRALWGRSWEAGGEPAYWPWLQILRSLVRVVGAERFAHIVETMAPPVAQLLAELPPPAAELRRRGAEPAADAASARFVLFDAVGTLLREIAGEAPLFLVLDDLHAADESTLRLLLFVARELRDVPLLILGTFREAALSQENFHHLSDIMREGMTLRLAGLGIDDLCRFVEIQTGTRPDLELAGRLLRATNGNPFFLDEIIQLMRTTGGSLAGETIGLPLRVRDAVRRRLGSASGECRALLEVAAIVGRDFDLGIVAAAAGRSWSEATERLEEARHAGLLLPLSSSPGRYRFGHDLTRQTLAEDLAPDAAARIHLCVAEAVERSAGIDLEPHLATLAHHFFEATAVCGPGPAVKYGVRAARQAIARSAFEEAARLLGRALERAGENDADGLRRRAEILVLLGEARWGCGEFEQSKEAYAEAARLADRAGDGRLAGAAALGFGALHDIGLVDEALLAHLRRALELLGTGEPGLRAMLLGRLAEALTFSERTTERDACAAEAVAAARQSGDGIVLAEVLCTTDYATQNPDNLRERLHNAAEIVRLAQDARDGHVEGQGHAELLRHHLELGDIDGVDREIATHRRLAEPLRRPWHRWTASVHSAMRAILEGDLAGGETLAAKALAIGQEGQNLNAVQAFGIQLIQIRWEQGRLGEMVEAVRTEAERTPGIAVWHCGLAWMLAETGDEVGARAELDRLAARGLESIPRDMFWLPAMGYLADVVATLGDAALAAVLIEKLRPYADRCIVATVVAYRGSVARALGLLATTRSDYEAAFSHFKAAIDIEQRMRAHAWQARTRLSWARALIARSDAGDAERASAELGKALEIGERLHLPLLLDRARRLKDELARGMPTPGVEPSPSLAGVVQRFRKEQDFWAISWEGREIRLRDSKGLAYLGCLVHHPAVEFHAIELAALLAGEAGEPTGTRRPGRGELAEGGLEISRFGDAGRILDPLAKNQYRQRLVDLRQDLEESKTRNELARAARIEEEIEILTRELARALGRGGRDRTSASAAERARVSITKRITASIKLIAEHDPSLARHLRKTIRTGTFFSYTPDARSPISWAF